MVIWFIILFRFIPPKKKIDTSFKKDKAKVSYNLNSTQINARKTKLNCNDLTPFLTNKRIKRKFNQNIVPLNKRKSKQKKEPKIILVWPQIRYIGFIKKEKGEKLCLLLINDSLVKMKVNSFKSNLKVIRIYKDSVQVSFKEEKKIIKR